MKVLSVLLASFLPVAACVASNGQADLARALASAGEKRPVVSSCSFVASADSLTWHAIAAADAAGGGSYIAVSPSGRSFTLGGWSHAPEVTCHRYKDADRLNQAIEETETVDGAVKPVFHADFVCVSPEPVESVCWQYSEAESSFVAIGGWVT